MTKIRTRFAPSPTGPLHIGGVRTALYAYLFAKKVYGDFILRIEDTDTARTVEGAEDIINKSLEWCGIIPDEGVRHGGDYGPYKQSERKAIYTKYANQLLENGNAYYAFDTSDELGKWREKTAEENNGNPKPYDFTTRMTMRNSMSLPKEETQRLLDIGEPYVVRMKINESDNITFDDLVRGEITMNSHQLDDRILLKSDGMPTYHLANVVDDYLMEISHVIRGEEWLNSTPHHILLYRFLGWENSIPYFAHLPLILKPDGKGKLSKRDGDRLGFPVFCTEWTDPVTGKKTPGYKEMGFLPDAFVNFIAMMGWNDDTDQEIYNMGELIECFELDRVHKSGAKFDFDKAKWYNQQYIKNLPISELVDEFKKQLGEPAKNLTNSFIETYCELYRDRIEFLHQLPEVGSYMYHDIKEYDTDTLAKKWNDESAQYIKKLTVFISTLPFKSSNEIEEDIKKNMNENNQKMRQIMPILRIGLMGMMQGPSVFDAMNLLGKDETIKRLDYLQSLGNSIG